MTVQNSRHACLNEMAVKKLKAIVLDLLIVVSASTTISKFIHCHIDTTPKHHIFKIHPIH